MHGNRSKPYTQDHDGGGGVSVRAAVFSVGDVYERRNYDEQRFFFFFSKGRAGPAVRYVVVRAHLPHTRSCFIDTAKTLMGEINLCTF